MSKKDRIFTLAELTDFERLTFEEIASVWQILGGRPKIGSHISILEKIRFWLQQRNPEDSLMKSLLKTSILFHFRPRSPLSIDLWPSCAITQTPTSNTKHFCMHSCKTEKRKATKRSTKRFLKLAQKETIRYFFCFFKQTPTLSTAPIKIPKCFIHFSMSGYRFGFTESTWFFYPKLLLQNKTDVSNFSCHSSQSLLHGLPFIISFPVPSPKINGSIFKQKSTTTPQSID